MLNSSSMATSLLLADDSPTIAKILGMALQSENYEIRSVLTAEDAIKELKARPPYFFLIDLTLPGKNGYEFSKMIRADSKLKQVRILLLASAFDPVDDKLFAECGADAVIAKPFDPGELRAKLNQIQNAPLKMPKGSNVQGSLSGVDFQSPNPSSSKKPSSLPEPSPLELPEAGSADQLLLGSQSNTSSDADSILSSLLGSNDGGTNTNEPGIDLGANSDEPPAFDLKPGAKKEVTREFTNSTVLLDLSGEDPAFAPLPEQMLDLSQDFSAPEGSTAMIDVGSKEFVISQEPSAPLPPPAPLKTPPRIPSPGKTEEGLSANAQALAAFFEAEIDAKDGPPPPPHTPAPAPAEDDDSFDASLGSIDWGSPDNLNSWSSAPPTRAKPEPPAANAAPALTPKTPPISRPTPPARQELELSFSEEEIGAPPPAPPPMSAPTRPAAAPSLKESKTHAGASSGGDFLFDTGGSNFRFSDDYIRRITKSFTGSPDEMTLGRDPSPPKEQPVFSQASHDRAPVAPTQGRPSGGGAWSEEEVKQIEKIVREEVQMVVREVAEKVAWEVIPELAENIIRKELDRVLKQMEE